MRRVLVLIACFVGAATLWPYVGASTALAELVLPEDDPGRGLDVNHVAPFLGLPLERYALDATPRAFEGPGRMRCDRSSLVTYRSRSLRYSATVHEAFAERLARFDAYLVDRASRHYGRAPRRMRHRGAYNCRRARGRTARISEHAFGNAIDFEGFDLPPLRAGQTAPSAMPSRLRRGAQIRVARHWRPRRATDRYHAAFLHDLAEGLRQERRLFRGIVGPPRPRHHDHLHLDASPWRYAMFGYDRADE